MFFSKKNQANDIKTNPNPIQNTLVYDKKVLAKQYYGSITSKKIVEEVINALEVTNSLLESVKNINAELEKHDKHIDKTVEVSSSVAAFSEEVSASVDETMDVIDETLKKAEHGQKSFVEVLSSIQAIHETVSNMSNTLIQLSEKSSKIKEIIETIKGIAKTTHLLSLNANIEAARAGEAGKGFAVVAGEVKKLAESSSNSADKIAEIILEINTVTNDTINIINSGVEKVGESTIIAQNAGKVIDDMMCSVEKTKTISGQISDAVRDQAEKNQNMIYVIDELVQVSDAVKSLNENVSADSQRQKASLNQLKLSTSNLNLLLYSNIDKNQLEPTTFNFNLYKLATFDPHLTDESNSLNLICQLNLSLVQFGSGSDVIAGLAKNWYVDNDNLTWNFSLRGDVKFHNGRKVTAHDVKYSFERILSKELNSANQWLLSMIKGAHDFTNGASREVTGIVVTNDHLLKITLEYPYSSFLNNLASFFCAIVPKECTSQIGTVPIGAGPYKFLEYDKENKKLTLEKFDDYVFGQAFIDKLIINFNYDNTNDDFLAKTIDYIVVNNENKDLLEKNQYKILKNNSATLRFLTFNFTSNNPLVQNKLARQAMNYCIDKEKIIKDGFSGLASKATAMIPSSMIESHSTDVFSRNLNKAKELLRQSGITHNSLTIQVAKNGPNKAPHSKILEILISNFRDLNITLKPVEVDASIFNNADTIRQNDMVVFGWSADSGTADNFLDPLVNGENPSNRAKYNNNEVLSLIELMKKTSNPYKYTEYLNKVEEVLEDDIPWVTFCNLSSAYAIQSHVKGLMVHPLNFIKLADVWEEI